VVEHIDRTHREPRVTLRIDVVERDPPCLLWVADVDVFVDDDDELRERHEPLAPERVHHLVGVSRILLVDRHEYEVVEDSLGRHVIVDDFRDGELQQRKKDSLGRVSKIEVLHRWPANDGRRVDRPRAHGQRGDVHTRVEVGEGVIARVIAERAFSDERLRRINVTLDDELRFGGHLEVARHRFRQAHWRASEKSREQELIDCGR
jgi:hypothetical protein